MNLPSGLRWVLTAFWVLLASCATEPVAPPASVEYRPAQRSTLVTRRDLNFLVAKWQGSGRSTTTLALPQSGRAPRPVAQLLETRQGSELQVSVQWLPDPWTTRGLAGLEFAALEQLYSLVLRQEPQARYCLGSSGRPCDAARDGVSHAQLLQALAALRARAVGRNPDAVPWRVVEMQGVPPRSWDADVVGVRATGPQGPLAGVAVYFNRAPHSICSARTGADGVATCRLEDQHADGHQHDHATVVVATFPGDVRPDRVLLPSTRVLATTVGLGPPAFARPFVSPTGKP
jgi:hypothetical protein